MERDTNDEEIAIYPKRWVLLAATCITTLTGQFLSKSFGTSNLILSVYFDVSLATLDWILVGVYAGTNLITPVFAYLAYAKIIAYRSMSMYGTACLLVSCFVIVLTVQFPVIFPVSIAGTLLQGVANCVSISTSSFFAVLWFPDHQIGLAIACNTASSFAGFAIGASVPPFILLSPPLLNPNSMINSATEFRKWKKRTYCTLMEIYATLAVVFCLLLIYFWIHAEDLPPKPPTRAMLLQRTSHNERDGKSFQSFIKCTKTLFGNKTYVLFVIISGIIFNLNVIEILYVSQLVQTILGTEYNAFVSRTIATIAITYSLSAVVGSFISSKILSIFKHHATQIVLGIVLDLLCILGLLLSFYFKSLVGFYISKSGCGISEMLCTIPLYEVVTRHTYPINEALVTTWMAGGVTALLIILVEPIRAISDNTSPVSSLYAMGIIVTIALALSLFVKPSNRRGDMDQRLLLTSESEVSQLNQQQNAFE